MNVYCWNKEIDKVLLCADNVVTTRRHVMGTLSADVAAPRHRAYNRRATGAGRAAGSSGGMALLNRKEK